MNWLHFLEDVHAMYAQDPYRQQEITEKNHLTYVTLDQLLQNVLQKQKKPGDRVYT
jgi:hypothetical protein